jgi:hypothetical protein
MYSLNRVVKSTLLLALVCAIWFRVQGLNRSLWLDEAWVANSVLESTVSRMLFYDAWVPSPEPGFLLSSRLVTAWLGPSNRSFRMVPVAFSLVGLLSMLLLLRKLFPPVWVAFGFALFALSPAAILLARSFKQYSTQLAMAPVLLLAAVDCNQRLSHRNFAVLLVAILIAAVFSYPSVFLLPALIILLVQPRSEKPIEPARVKLAVLASLWGLAVFIFLYVAVIRHNLNDSLRLYFANPAVGVMGHLSRAATYFITPYKPLLPIPERLVDSTAHPVGFVAGLGIVGIATIFYRRQKSCRLWLVLAILLPQVAVMLLDLLDLYPANQRSMLFLLPCSVILVTSLVESVTATAADLVPGEAWRRTVRFTAPVATLLILAIGCRRQLGPQLWFQDEEEDVHGAIASLDTTFRDGDALYVHASVQEQFKLYARLLSFAPSAVQWGNTGWPCCPRRVEYWRGHGSVQQLEQDVARLYPVSLPSRLWELHTLRPRHWEYVGLDEGKALRGLLLQRGCTLALYREWHNVAVSQFACMIRHQTAGPRAPIMAPNGNSATPRYTAKPNLARSRTKMLATQVNDPQK